MIAIARASLAAVLLFEAAPLAADGVRVTYLANEGVRIEGGTCDVLIDALLRDSLGDYVRHEPAVQESIETGRPPFDRVKLALATHYHLDHWDAGAIARFLTSNPSAVFGAAPQAGAMLPSALKPRVNRSGRSGDRRPFESRTAARSSTRSRSTTGCRWRTSPIDWSVAGACCTTSAIPNRRTRTSRGSRRPARPTSPSSLTGG